MFEQWKRAATLMLDRPNGAIEVESLRRMPPNEPLFAGSPLSRS
jgi:hypothetical protein